MTFDPTCCHKTVLNRCKGCPYDMKGTNMKVIWKFSLSGGVEPVITLPEGSEILRVAYQDYDICLWALVDTTKNLVKRTFKIFGTGMYFDGDCKYIGTVENGVLVWHIFDFGETK